VSAAPVRACFLAASVARYWLTAAVASPEHNERTLCAARCWLQHCSLLLLRLRLLSLLPWICTARWCRRGGAKSCCCSTMYITPRRRTSPRATWQRSYPSSSALSLLLLVMMVLVGRTGATLPADNGGAPVFEVGDLAPTFSVVCSNASSSELPASNYTLKLGGRSSDPLVPNALVIMSMHLGDSTAGIGPDLFVQHMATDNASLDAFLGSDAVGLNAAANTSYLFLARAPSDAEAARATAALRDRLTARAAAKQVAAPPESALARMHFAIQSTNNSKGLAGWLAQWTTPVTSIVFSALDRNLGSMSARVMSRLDGKYTACQWPRENQQLSPIVDGGDGCVPLDRDRFGGKWVNRLPPHTYFVDHYSASHVRGGAGGLWRGAGSGGQS
jgi:hypothetical protein